MHKVSVIIPIYGVEKYIERCARSLMEQTLDDIEYIFVNDCTTDSSMEILSQVINEYDNRKGATNIIHHAYNRGLPQARQTGLLYASGQYIVHCDSDDWIDSQLYETMYNTAIAKDVDMVVCDCKIIKETSVDIRQGTRETNISNYTINMLFQKDPLSMWNKMIKKSIYENNIIFPQYNMGEDMATTLQLARYCKTLAFVEGVYYYYDGTTLSITRNETKAATLSRALQACANAQLVIDAFSRDTDNNVKHGLTHLKFMQRKLMMPIINHKDVYKIWKNTFPEINREVLFKRAVKINFYNRLKFFLTLINLLPYIKELTRKSIN